MIYNNVHQLRAEMASQQADLADSKRKQSAKSGLEFQQQMQMTQQSMQDSLKTGEASDNKDSRTVAGTKFEAFLNSYVANQKPASLFV